MNWSIKYPALVSAIGIVVGIIIFHLIFPNHYFYQHLSLFTYVVVLLTGLGSVIYLKRKKIRLELLIFVVSVALGFFRFESYSIPICKIGGDNFNPMRSVEGEYEAVVYDIPTIDDYEQVRFTLLLVKQRGPPEKKVEECIVYAYGEAKNLAEDMTKLIPGELVLTRLSLSAPKLPKNPGEKDRRLYLWFNSISLSGSIKNLETIKNTVEYSVGFFTQIALFFNKVRGEHYRFIMDHFSKEKSSLLAALLIGSGNTIAQDTRTDYSKSGLAHLLSISGLHIGLIIAVIFLALRSILLLFFLKRQSDLAVRTSAFLSLMFLCAYIFYAGGAPSAIRAGIISAFFLIAIMIYQPVSAINSLGNAVIITLLWNPIALFMPSFQLSYLAFTGVLLSVKWVMPIIREEFPLLQAKKNSKVVGKILCRMSEIFISSLVISLLTAPLTLYHFDTLSIISPIANILGIPLMSFLILPCILLSAVSLILGNELFTCFFLNAAGFYMNVLSKLATFFAGNPLAIFFPSSTVRITFIILFMTLILWIIFKYFLLVKFNLLYRSLFIIIVFGLFFLINTSYTVSKNYDLSIYFLAVGEGDSAIIELPGGKVMLIDAPGSTKSNYIGAEKNIIAPFLLTKKIDRIDYLVISHAHLDHFGGVQYLIENFKIGEFWFNGNIIENERYQKVLSTLIEKKIPIYQLYSGKNNRIIANGVFVQIINPAKRAKPLSPTNDNLNNNSLVLRICYSQSCALFTGDIHKKSEKQILKRSHDISSKLLKIPHHGSKTSSSAEFLDSIMPEVAILTAEKQNKYNFPGKGVIERYNERKIKVLDPNIVGTVSIFFSKPQLVRYKTYFE